MKAFIFLLMCGLGAGTLAAQTLTGKVTDMKQQAVEAATVVLQAADSTYIDATLTDSLGVFRFGHTRAYAKRLCVGRSDGEGRTALGENGGQPADV